MVIKERKTADSVDAILRSSPIFMKLLNKEEPQATGCWIDWFTEENFRKVHDNLFYCNSS